MGGAEVASGVVGPMVSAGARILGAAIGRAQASGDYEEAMRLQKQALAEYGTADPNALLKIDVQQQKTEFDKNVEDPTAKNAQMLALSRLGRIANESSPEDAAAYAQSQQETGNAERGMREAMLRRLQEQGMGQGSGLGLAAQLNAAQMGTQQKSQADLQTAAMARQRALAALGQMGGMAGDMRGQNYQQMRDRASAQDAINQFNAKQRFGQAQSTFGNQMDLANAKSGAYDTLANAYNRQGDATQAAWAGAGDAIGDAVDSVTKKKKGP